MKASSRAFVLGAFLAIGALLAATWAILDLEARARTARDAAAAEQVVGRALLRMDAVLMPLLAGEVARWWPGRPNEPAAPFLRERFELGPAGPVRLGGEKAAAAAPERLQREFPAERLLNLAPEIDAAALQNTVPTQITYNDGNDLQSYEGRNRFVQNLSQQAVPIATGPSYRFGPFAAAFLHDGDDQERLFCVRRVEHCPDCTLQGVRIDWPQLEAFLKEQISDLLPGARLRPAAADDTTRRLASLPVQLEPGPLAPLATAETPGRWLLPFTWLAVLGSLLVVGLALRAATDLGERRALFVSSVTHELRTPLTTFRMYSQMLADGMVPENARGEYLGTLCTEAERLTRIVESVLLYARLEDGRGGGSARRTTIGAAELFARLQEPLRARTADAGRAIGFAAGGGLDAVRVHVDPQAVEQIVTNLVDNACKYAPPGPLEVAARAAGGGLVIAVRDPGPGIAPAAAARLFEPFQRGVEHRTGTIPGLGLGLAIARGLARAMGGDLVVGAPGGGGTVFEVRLPGVG